MQDGPFDEEASQNLFNNMMKMWIEPELQRRVNEGNPYARDIDHCMILLPNQQKPIVRFNDENSIMAFGRKAPKKFEYGQDMYLYDIQEILHVFPPKVDDKRVSFVHLILANMQWYIFFDFSPGHSDYAPQENDRDWPMGKSIAEVMNLRIQERIIKSYVEEMKRLEKIGLWSVPSLFPYPMSLILQKLSEKDEQGALSVLMSHCNSKYLEGLIAKWFDIESFVTRKKIIEDALSAHKDGKWGIAIHSLFPHMEGIMNEWMSSGPLKALGLPTRQIDRVKKFSELANKKSGSFTYKHLAESSTSFILGPVLTKIDDWKKHYGPNVPNRHIVGHGDYDERYYSEENSIKVILLLDTIHYLIRNHGKV